VPPGPNSPNHLDLQQATSLLTTAATRLSNLAGKQDAALDQNQHHRASEKEIHGLADAHESQPSGI